MPAVIGADVSSPPLLAQASPIDPWVILGSWTLDPLLIVSLGAVATLYTIGLVRLWRSAGPGRVVRRCEAASFMAGWLVLVAATVSPLHATGLALFTAHMIQHEMLMLAAAPLIVLGRPLPPILRALPAEVVRELTRLRTARAWSVPAHFLMRPAAAWAIHFVALWIWHVPALFERALYSETAHVLEHASFFGSALLFWAVLAHEARSRTGYGAGILYVFTTGMHNALLGALLTFSSRPWYDPYALTAPLWGLTPLEDQQLGGVIMWAPAGFVYVGAGCLLLAALLRQSDRLATRGRGAVHHTTDGPSRE